MPDLTVRTARPEDGPALIALIRGLADYEKLEGPDEDAAARVLRDMFREEPPFRTLVAEARGEIVGYVAFFEEYSTFEGRKALYLEDIFVLPEFRGSGAGLALFRAVAVEAARRECMEIKWEALPWNKLAIDFYERLGARRDETWHTYRMDEEALLRVAAHEAEAE